MKYIGAIKPEFPANAFGVSIFRDSEGCFFEQEIGNNFIQRFVPIKGMTKAAIHLIDVPVDVSEHMPPIYSYFRANWDFFYGTYKALSFNLLSLIESHETNYVAKIILSSFFSIHGITYRLIEKHSGESSILIRPETFLPITDLPPDKVSIEDLLYRTIEKEQLYASTYKFTLEDMICYDDNFFYIETYRISNKHLTKFMDEISSLSPLWKVTLKLLMFYSNRSESNPIYLDFESIYRNDTSWVPHEGLYSARYREYKNAFGGDFPQTQILTLGFAAENQMFAHSTASDHKYAPTEHNPYQDLAQLVKRTSIRKQHEPFVS